MPKRKKLVEKKSEEIADNGTVEEIIENYFGELDRFKKLIQEAEAANKMMSESEGKVDLLLHRIYKMLRDTDSNSVLVEREGKRFIFILSGNNVSIQEVITPKELKTKLAVNKLLDKEEEKDNEDNSQETELTKMISQIIAIGVAREGKNGM